MRTTCIFIAALAALATIVPARAADPIRHIGFESDADLSGLSLAENTWPVTLRRAVDAGEAAGGRASLLLAFRFRKAGYCYPMFPLKQSIRLEDGPVYFSGCLKILEQHPEAWHNWCFTVFGEYPKKAAGWKGFEVRVSSRADLANGWQYFYSGDLREAARANAEKQGTPFEGAVITGFYARTTTKYGDRGVRYVHMEAGHAAQNVYLQAFTLGLGTVSVGAFADNGVRRILGLAPEETPLYVMPVGTL